jgi:hypothetical protein
MPTGVRGSCLCGAVELTIARKPRTLTQCNCSVCRRYGTLWAYYRRRAVTIEAKRGALASYAVRAKGLRFVRCKTCGCVVCWDSARKGPDVRMGINARLLDHAAMAGVTISVLDGDQTWKVVEHYTKPAMFVSPVRE